MEQMLKLVERTIRVKLSMHTLSSLIPIDVPMSTGLAKLSSLIQMAKSILQMYTFIGNVKHFSFIVIN